jgi:preprotein translocase subunit SecF
MTMTLTIVNLLGMKVSTAGIIAFLMLIGYSVDTDILLTTRVLKRKGENVNSRIWGSFKTGITMTLTSISVVIIGYFLTASFSKVLHQLFLILAIGLFFDILNTWVTNASIVKWYTDKYKLD